MLYRPAVCPASKPVVRASRSVLRYQTVTADRTTFREDFLLTAVDHAEGNRCGQNHHVEAVISLGGFDAINARDAFVYWCAYRREGASDPVLVALDGDAQKGIYFINDESRRMVDEIRRSRRVAVVTTHIGQVVGQVHTGSGDLKTEVTSSAGLANPPEGSTDIVQRTPAPQERRTTPTASRVHISQGRLTCCIWLGDQSSLATGGFTGNLYMTDASGILLHQLHLGNSIIRCVTQADDSKADLIVGDDLGRLTWVDLINGATCELARAKSSVFSLSRWPGRGILYTAERSGAIIEWKLAEGTPSALCLRVVHRHAGPAFAVCFDVHTRTCWSVGADGKLLGSSLDSAPNFSRVYSHSTLFTLAMQGGTLAVGDSAGRLLVRGQGSPEPILFEGHSDAVRKVALSLSGCWLGSAGKDGTVRLWHLPSGRSYVVAESRDYLYDIVFSPRGDSLLACDGSGDLLFLPFGRSVDDISPSAMDAWCTLASLRA
ncbi:MAG: WD40 repeat domain-containing protein [Polyangia bacterium]